MNSENLLRVPLLRVLSRSRVEDLARKLPIREVSAGQVVARSGDPASHLIIVESGSLVGSHETAAGATVQVATAAGPCTLDKAASLDERGTHTATWTATTTCQLRQLPVPILRQLLDEEPALREHVLNYLAAEVNTHRRAKTRSAAPDPIAQVADWLLETSPDIGSSIQLPNGQQGLANDLGLSRVTVNRALSSLAALGTIQVHLRLVVVRDPVHLTTASINGRATATRPPKCRPD